MPKQRNLAIDRFRGFTVILMVIVNDLGPVHGFPSILGHAPDEGGIGLADLVSKFFIFAIATTYLMSFNSRLAASGSRWKTYFHFVSRYLAIMGLGALFGAFMAEIEGGPVWGTLHTIGLAGLLTLLVIRLPWWGRAASGMAVLAAYQLVYQFANGAIAGEIGAVIKALTMTGALMLSTAVVDLFNKGRKPFLIALGVLTLAAFGPLLLPGAYITKENQITFILICVTIAAAVFFIFDLVSKKVKPTQPGLLCWWGENPMLLYVLHLMLIGASQAIHPRPMAIAIPINIAILTALSLIAWGMHRKKFQISF